jgi:hypothetical protein
VSNLHAGEVIIAIGGRSYTLVYDWAAIANLTDAFGKEFDSVLGEAMDKLDTAVLARALEIGLRKHHPSELDAVAITQASPPLVSVNSAISEALTRAFWGAEKPQERSPANPPIARLTALWQRLSGPLRKPVSSRASSGG